MKKILFLTLTVALLAILLVSCNGVAHTESPESSSTAEASETPESSSTEVTTAKPVVVALEIRDMGTIKLELYPNIAPKTVENFLSYVKSGFYEGVIFHRVIEDFMIQAGDKDGDGVSDPSLPTIFGEFTANGFRNDLEFERGVIGLARGPELNSASSQFFICHVDTPNLNGLYAAFGRVIEGIEVVDAIATCEKTDDVDANGSHYKPLQDVVIQRAYVVE